MFRYTQLQDTYFSLHGPTSTGTKHTHMYTYGDIESTCQTKQSSFTRTKLSKP